ncbi:MAG TPA: hypothetical protein PKL31_03615 [Fulvivirga sp.]|nr:hypothetical protein [Fulvivirga sp.]
MIGLKHRNELINRIKSIDDKNIIDEIYRLLEIEFDDKIFVTTQAQKNEIGTAKNQISAGKGIDSSQADSDIDQWLEK